MTREGRSVFLAILTLLVYAGILFIENGKILFPFPLNELIFLIITIQFTIWNWKKYKLVLSFILLAALCNLVSTTFFWSFFINTLEMQSLWRTTTPDLLKISFYLFISAALAISILQSSQKNKNSYFFIFQGALITSVLLSNQIAETITFTAISVFAVAKKLNSPIHLLWVLLAVLQIMKMLTLYF